MIPARQIISAGGIAGLGVGLLTVGVLTLCAPASSPSTSLVMPTLLTASTLLGMLAGAVAAAFYRLRERRIDRTWKDLP